MQWSPGANSSSVRREVPGRPPLGAPYVPQISVQRQAKCQQETPCIFPPRVDRPLTPRLSGPYGSLGRRPRVLRAESSHRTRLGQSQKLTLVVLSGHRQAPGATGGRAGVRGSSSRGAESAASVRLRQGAGPAGEEPPVDAPARAGASRSRGACEVAQRSIAARRGRSSLRSRDLLSNLGPHRRSSQAWTRSTTSGFVLRSA